MLFFFLSFPSPASSEEDRLIETLLDLALDSDLATFLPKLDLNFRLCIFYVIP
jgi:hypothetical protein